MSLLSDWLAANMHPHGETLLGDIEGAFRGAVCKTRRLRDEWPTGLIVQELGRLGYQIALRGRKDQPARFVVGLSFEPMPVDKRLQRQIVDYVYAHTVGRYLSTSAEGDGWDETTAWQRPDYDPALYRHDWASIAARLTAAGIPCTEREARVAFQRNAALYMQYVDDPEKDYNFEERETALDRYVRCLTPDGLVDRRWLVAGETPAGCDHYGVPHPIDGPATKRWVH